MDEKIRARYQRQMLFTQLGESGQKRLGRARVVQVGCGALGSTISQCLVRAGVGAYTLIDPDRAELTNLHRQFLFDEKDVANKAFKAQAGADRLTRAASHATINGVVAALGRSNIQDLLSGHNLVMDALDNMQTRFLINDWCVKNVTPWIYGAVAGASGMTMVVTPQAGPCLRCLYPNPQEAMKAVNTDTAGIINTAPAAIAAIQATEAIKLIAGSPDSTRELRIIDLWAGTMQSISVRQNPACPCCGKGIFEFLNPE